MTHRTSRKTVNISDLVATANRHLAYAQSAEARVGIAQLLSDALHDANAYAGFGYLPSELNSQHQLIPGYDDTRRFYYDPIVGGRGGAKLRSLYEAVRWVVQDERYATDEPVSPAQAIKNAQTVTVSPHWAYRLVQEAVQTQLDLALRARYGSRIDRYAIPS